MNYIVPAKMHFPVYANPASTRPVTSVAASTDGYGDVGRQRPSIPVYRGELLDAPVERQYRPQYNLQISPENRRAIHTYQKVAQEQPVIGRILNGFI